jgi:cytoskeletal protein CcmA (bactofilin family)
VENKLNPFNFSYRNCSLPGEPIMFRRRKKPKCNTPLDTLIGQHTQIKGDIIFRGGLRVEGCVKGDVIAEDENSLLIISKDGAIEGHVKVPYIILNGSIAGDVHAAEHIDLSPQAQVDGDVYYHLIEIAMGAKVNGNLIHIIEAAEEEPMPTLKLTATPEIEPKPLNRGLKEKNP